MQDVQDWLKLGYCGAGKPWCAALLKTSVPDPKLIISDPDPQIENQEFLIRILL